MAFPQLRNKHLLEALFTADEYVKYRKWDKKGFPKKIIITYQRLVVQEFKKTYRGKYRTIILAGGQELFVVGDIGLTRMSGIGSPHACAQFEELIALGGKTFITFGAAGGLSSTGIFVCNKAVRDEGTSHHYVKDGLYAHPDTKLTKALGATLKRQKFAFTVAPSWTIDAPYRETKREIAHYRKLGVKTVEMEASALFTVATLRRVRIAALFVVSDIVGGEEWKPQFHTFDYKKTLRQMLHVAIDCLKAPAGI